MNCKLLRANTRTSLPAFWVSGFPAIKLTGGLAFCVGILVRFVVVCFCADRVPRSSSEMDK